MAHRTGGRPASGAGGQAATRSTRKEGARKGGRGGGRERDVLHRVQGSAVKGKKMRATPAALLLQAEDLLREGRPEEALPVAKRALEGLQRDSQDSTTSKTQLPALNLLAQIHLEIGDGDAARGYFLQAVELDPEGSLPEAQGGGAEKFLWLAQLSEEGGRDSVGWFEKGAEVLRSEISKRMGEGEGDGDDEGMEAMMRKLASALCGIVEIYMTDLSWDPSAETHCETLITEALLSSPHSPEPLQTLASIRISQTRIPEAKQALSDSLDLWRELPPGHTSVPDFPTRISLARLLMEVGLEELALEVVERLVGEDDQSVEAWYLGGWCLYLLGGKRRGGGKMEDGGEEMVAAEWVSSREWLRQGLTLCELLEYEDERLREHAVELVHELDGELEGRGIIDGGDEGPIDGEWESEDEDGKDEDQEMHGT